MTTPIMDAVNQYISRNAVRMHMPGHKGNLNGIFSDIAKYDLTEVTGVDSLYECDDCILRCEEEYSKIYGTKRSIISASGSTLCIQTMLALVSEYGGKIIAGRNIHISAVNAMGLLGLEPIWIYPEQKSGTGIPGIISPEKIKEALEKNDDIAAVYITTPDYFGVLSDVKTISEICHSHNVPLLIDNAHGAGLKFLPESLHPIDLGADMCCDSLHKTMPVFTGGAILHINNEIFAKNAKRAMSLFGTTSPSYLIMETIDMALDYIKSGDAKKDFCFIKSWTREMNDLAQKHGFEIPNGLLDPAKFAFCFGSKGYTKDQFYNLLTKYNIEPEYMSENYCVFMPTGFNTSSDFENIKKLIEETPNIGDPIPIKISYERNKSEITLRKALLSPKINIPIEEAEGKIAAETKSKCPPGIPLVIPGEKITKNLEKNLISYGIFNINVVQ